MVNKRTTLKDVAQASGVSAMSASKALNNKGGVSDKTRQHILQVARQLNYRPNMVAKSLRLDETKTLGVVVSDSSEMVMAKVLRGIADSAEKAGYNILMVNTDSDSAKERRAVEVLINKCIDGLLMIAPTLTTREDAAWLSAFDTPIVLLMRESRYASIDSVINNNVQGGFEIVERLLQRGCRSLRFLSLTSVSQIGDDRLEGSKRALSEHGLALDMEKVRYSLPRILDAKAVMQQMIDEGFDGDAVVCGCDVIAIGAIDALRENGIRVPEQVCVSGYDDIELAGYLRVPLTTMRQPLYEIGQKGVQIVLERIHSPQQPVQRVVLSSTLVERESTSRLQG